MSRDALVVGINQYPYISHLKTPAFDAEAIAHILEHYGNFRVKRLPFTGQIDSLQVDPKQSVTVAELKTAIAQLFNPQGDNIPDTALLYFAGHGLRETLGGISEGYLATSDACPRKNIWGISLQWLRRLLQESPVRQQIVWLDCCHSGELLNFDEADPGNREGLDRCFIAASRDFEVAYGGSEHGVLTNALLQALDPKRHPEGRVTTKTHVASLKQALEAVPVPQRFRHDYSGNEIILTLDRKENSTHPAFAGCPYKGLDYFKTEDHEYFYGRTALTDKLLEKVRSKNFLVVLGASGSGKSSLVRAGLLYQLQQGLKLSGSDRWQIYQPFTPGENPLQRLAEVMGKELQTPDGKFLLEQVIKDSASDRVVLVVDQFEEVFTLCQNNSKRQQFFDCLLDILEQTGNKFCLVLVMRTDFLDKCLPYSRLATLLGDETTHAIVTPMTAKQLEEAIRVPASKVGLEIENALIKQILEDLGASNASGTIEGETEESDQKREPESLPLLEYTLEQLWLQPRTLDLLTLTSYQELGGVRGALRKQADAIFHELTPEEQVAARRIFVSLTQLGEGTEDTRRRVAQTDLVTAQLPAALIDRVVQKFAQKRLLVITSGSATGEREPETVSPLIEVAHEALIRHWPRLRGWLDENREMLRRQRRIDAEAKQWAENGKKPEYLLQGSRLGDAEEFLATYPEELSTLAVELVWESERERDRLQKERDRQRRRTILSLTSGLVAVSIFATGAVWQWQRAESERRIAQLRQIVAQAGLIREQQPNESQLNILLAIEVMRRQPDLEVDQTLKKGLDLLPASTVSIFHKDLEAFVLSADGRHLITTSGLRGHSWMTKSIKSQEIVRVWNIESGSEVIKFHPKGIGDVVFSKNGKYLARASNKNILKIWDIVTGQEVMQINHQEKYEFLSLSADGKYIAGASSTTVYIWEVSSGKEIARLVHKHNIDYGLDRVFVFSPNSKYIATSSYMLDGEKQHIAQVWEISSGKKVIQRENKEPFYKITFSPDSKYLATFAADIAASGSFSDNTVRIDEITTARTVVELKHINLHQNTHHGSSVLIKDMAFSPNGKYLATIDSGEGRSLTLWEVANSQTIFNLKHEGKEYELNVEFSPDGKYLISTDNQTTKIWDATNGKEVARIPGSLGLYNSFTSNGKYLVTADGDTAKIWNIDNIGSHFLKISYEDFAKDIVFSPDGKHLASVGDSKTVKVWEIDKTKKTLEVEQDGVNAISFSSNGQYLATASKNSAQIWQIAGHQKIMQMKPSQLVQKLIFSQNGQYLAAVSGGTRLSDSNDIQIWNITTGKEILHLEFERPVQSIAFSSDNKYIFTNVYLVNPSFKMWEISSGRTIVEIGTEENDFVKDFALHPNNHYLALGGKDGVLIWDLVNGKKIKFLKIDKTDVQHITYSPNGKYIATTSDKDITQIWEIESAKEIMKIKFTDPWLSGISFSPDGEYIGTAMNDYTARIWNISNGKEISRITHKNRVNTVAFSQNGKYIATASDDGTAFVSFWQPEDLMSEACKRLTRNLSIEEWQQYFPNEPYRKTCYNLPIHTTSK